MLSSGEIACNFEYIIWSITQTADLIYNMIEKNWPNAKLRAVIDRSKKVNYKGMQSYTKEKSVQKESTVNGKVVAQSLKAETKEEEGTEITLQVVRNK